MSSNRSTSLAVTLALALTLGPSSAALAIQPSEDPSLAEAQSLYDEGMNHFTLTDYDAALMNWNRAYGLVAPSPANRQIRTALAFKIAEAHGLAYAVDRNPEHLVEGMRLIDSRKAEIARLYGQDSTALTENESLDAKRSELAQLYANANAAGESSQPLTYGTALVYDAPQQQAAPAGPPPPAGDPAKALELAVAADPEFGPQYRQGKSMGGGGVALVITGSIGAIVAIALAGTGTVSDSLSQGLSGRRIPFGENNFYVGAVVVGGISVLMLGGGGALLGVGGGMKKRAKQGYMAREYGQTAGLVPIPLVLPRGGGAGFALRF